MGVQFRVSSEGRYDPDQFDMVYVSSPDIHGVSRGRFVMRSSFPGVVKHGLGMTKGALVGGITVDIPVGLTDLKEEGWGSGIQMPDMATLRPMSWLSTEEWKVGSVICDFESTTGDRDKTSSREIAKAQLRALESMGINPMVAALAEFTLFYKNSIKPVPLHENVSNLLVNLSLEFEQSGIQVEAVGLGMEPGKLQITMKEQPALLHADDLFRLHTAVRFICCKAGYDVTFMTKALQNLSSNIVQLTWRLLDRQQRNLFSNKDQPLTPSKFAHHFMAGQVKHSHTVCALTRPTINCYRDVTTLSRIDAKSQPVSSATVDEVKRSPEMTLLWEGEDCLFQGRMATSASNPYLVVATVLAAGIDGLSNKLGLPNKESQWAQPAQSLTEALESLNRDIFMKDQLGALFVKRFIYVKTKFEIKSSDKTKSNNKHSINSNVCHFQGDRQLYLYYI